MSSHDPAVLADLVARLRRDPTVRALYTPGPTAGALADANPEPSTVHEIERADMEALIASRCPPLEFDRFATAILCGAVRP